MRPTPPRNSDGGPGRPQPRGTRLVALARLPPLRLLDPDRRAVRRILQRLGRQVGVAHGDLGVGVPENLLHLIQRAAAIDQKTRVHVAQVMQTQMIQASFLAYPMPNYGDRGIRFAGMTVDEQVLELPAGIQLCQQFHGARVQRHRTQALALGVDGPDSEQLLLQIDICPLCRQYLVQPAARTQQKQRDLTYSVVGVAAQHIKQSFQFAFRQVMLDLVTFMEQRNPDRGIGFSEFPFNG